MRFLIVAKTALGNPIFKPSEGDRFDVLRVGEDSIESEVQQVSGTQVLIRLKVRPEAFPTGSPMSVWSDFLQD
jgi:hypothetical protein